MIRKINVSFVELIDKHLKSNKKILKNTLRVNISYGIMFFTSIVFRIRIQQNILD